MLEIIVSSFLNHTYMTFSRIRSPICSFRVLLFPVTSLLSPQSKYLASSNSNQVQFYDMKRPYDHDPTVLTGKPVVKGTRLAVEFIIDLLAHD